MTHKHQFRDYVLDILQPHGPITAKSLFGGYGIYYDGVIMGVIVDNELYFKVDEQTAPDYQEKGSSYFVYTGKSKSVTMPYMKVPAPILEQSSTLGSWVERAYEVGLRAKKAKKR